MRKRSRVGENDLEWACMRSASVLGLIMIQRRWEKPINFLSVLAKAQSDGVRRDTRRFHQKQ